jgi:hypothetical protein
LFFTRTHLALTFFCTHSQRQEVFCKIRCSLTRLQKHADLVNYMVPFDPDALRKVCKEGRDVGAFLSSFCPSVVCLRFFCLHQLPAWTGKLIP